MLIECNNDKVAWHSVTKAYFQLPFAEEMVFLPYYRHYHHYYHSTRDNTLTATLECAFIVDSEPQTVCLKIVHRPSPPASTSVRSIADWPAWFQGLSPSIHPYIRSICGKYSGLDYVRELWSRIRCCCHVEFSHNKRRWFSTVIIQNKCNKKTVVVYLFKL